ncbi:hypothetical protein ND2E_2076 [Colwellia psychrerythraea]|uniref:Uncharacterized protein n=1 Tax=Colwellia psychrerythraea TaxID=28229 RepID=A0A099KWY8_COLPS|nr:hypothetical protein ND2E_2076 [Colwellia psychrerythraea]
MERTLYEELYSLFIIHYSLFIVLRLEYYLADKVCYDSMYNSDPNKYDENICAN